MRTVQPDVIAPTEQLQQAVNAPVLGRERAWAKDVATALTSLEEALRWHAARATSPDGVFAEVDQTRPTLLRRIGELQRELVELVSQTADLQEQAKQETRSRETTGPTWAALGVRAAQLVTAVRRLVEQEADLVLESVNTDLGTGD
jgi:hypothetical protein